MNVEDIDREIAAHTQRMVELKADLWDEQQILDTLQAVRRAAEGRQAQPPAPATRRQREPQG